MAFKMSLHLQVLQLMYVKFDIECMEDVFDVNTAIKRQTEITFIHEV